MSLLGDDERKWTGAELRQWAEIVSTRIDAGLTELTVDVNRHSMTSNDFVMKLRGREKRSDGRSPVR